MNNRDYKNFTAGYVYHVYNRGNEKRIIFNDSEDHLFFVKRLKENIFPSLQPKRSKKNTYVRKILPLGSFDLICYCLMPNHFHLLIRQNTEIDISKLMSKLCTSYSKYFNKKYNRVGVLFQDQFKAVRIDSDEQMNIVIEYIYNNPLRAGLVSNWRDYPYTGVEDALLQTNI
jgi:putative transposase